MAALAMAGEHRQGHALLRRMPESRVFPRLVVVALDDEQDEQLCHSLSVSVRAILDLSGARSSSGRRAQQAALMDMIGLLGNEGP